MVTGTGPESEGAEEIDRIAGQFRRGDGIDVWLSWNRELSEEEMEAVTAVMLDCLSEDERRRRLEEVAPGVMIVS